MDEILLFVNWIDVEGYFSARNTFILYNICKNSFCTSRTWYTLFSLGLQYFIGPRYVVRSIFFISHFYYDVTKFSNASYWGPY